MPTKPDIKIKYSQQEILNMSFDEVLRTLVFQLVDTPAAQKVTISGQVIYIGTAPTGSSESSAVWQAQKIDTSSGVVIKWADSGNFTQVATDLTALTYA